MTTPPLHPCGALPDPTCARRGAGGFAAAFVVVIFIAFIAVAGLAVDGGGAAATKARAQTIADEAARAGAGALDIAAFRADSVVVLDPAAAQAAATDWLAATGANGTVQASATDVTVTVTADYATQLLGTAGLDTITVTATATAAPDQGEAITAGGTSP